MLLVKGDSSFRRKGKEVAIDDPPAKTVDGEDPHSKLNHFEDKEGVRDPGSECPPLINPWYDTHICYPVVLGDYSPPLSSRVCISICRRDTEVFWAPLASSILEIDNC